MKFFRLFVIVLVTLIGFAPFVSPLTAGQSAQLDFTHHVFLPLIASSSCQDIAGESYSSIVPVSPPTDRPAEQHADLNLALRGYAGTTGILGLIDLDGPADGRAPKIFSLFADNRVPEFSGVARVYEWNWATNSRGTPILDPPVTLANLSVTPNEPLRVPRSEYNIGTISFRPPRGVRRDAPSDDPNSFEVLILYASKERITLKYTREDNVVRGYTMHVENVCVAPALLALYYEWNGLGRGQLPALKQGQAFGRATGDAIGVVIRDNGTFMEPRSRKDWW